MNKEKIKYHTVNIILHLALIIGVWALIFVLIFNCAKIEGFIFLATFSLIHLFSTLCLYPQLISYFKKKGALVFEKDQLIYIPLNLSIKFNDINKYSIYYSPGGAFLILKLNDFHYYSGFLRKSLLGKIALLNFNIFGKSIIFINFRFLETSERDILNKIKSYVNKNKLTPNKILTS